MRGKTKNASPINNNNAATNGHEMIHMQTAPFIAESSLRQLQQLYGNRQERPAVESIGTLPAASMEATVIAANKAAFTNKIVPPRAPASKKQQSKITADLMDVDFDWY